MLKSAPHGGGDPVTQLLAKLPGARPSGSRWMARCPAHRDDKPSLQIARGHDGRALVKCFAGCSLDDILSALDVPITDLFVQDTGHYDLEVIYTYHDEAGKIAYQVVRKAGKEFKQRRPNGHGTWVWNLEGVKRLPYRLPELLSADPETTVFVVEGEKDVDKLALHGILATTNSGGAGKWTDEHSAYLQGRHVVVLPDNDDPGHKHAEIVACSLEGVAESIRVLPLPGLRPSGDVSDWLDAGHTARELVDAAQRAPLWGAPVPPGPGDVPIEVPVRDAVRLVRVWEEDEPEPRAFTVGALVPDKAVTLFYGDGGQGKSYIALYMGMVACLGRPFVGHLVQQSPVLFLDAELDDVEFRRRAYKMARGIDMARPPRGLHYLQLPGSLSDPTVQTLVRAAVEESGAGFVILDSLTIGSFAVDAADPSDMIKVVKFLESLGCAVLAIDHIAKPMPGTNLSQYRAYGSVFKGNVARSAIQIVRAEGGGLTLLHKKSNFSALSDPVHIALEFEEDAVRVVGLSPDDERLVGAEENLPAIDQVYRELSQYRDGARPEFLAMEMGKSVKTVKNQLTALSKQNRARAVGDGTWVAEVPF